MESKSSRRLTRRCRVWSAGAAGEDSDEWRQHDRRIGRIDLSELLEVRGDGARAAASGSLGPGIHQLEPGGHDQARKERADVRVPSIGHRHGHAVDPAGAGDWFLGHHPSTRSDCCGHGGQPGERLVYMEEKEAAERQINRLGQREVFYGLGQSEDLGVGGRSGGNEVTSGGIDVDGIDTTLSTDDLAEGDGHVTEAGADVDASPAGTNPEPSHGGGQWAPVDVVT